MLQVISIEGVLERLVNNQSARNISSMSSKCAACGKDGDNLKVCTSCEQVSYCNAKCRKAHRSKHKKECKQYTTKIRDMNALIRATMEEVHLDTVYAGLTEMDISDDKIFQDAPPKKDCEICFLPMPYATGACRVRTTYMTCCGKTLCNGCIMAVGEETKEGKLKRCCPCCRVPLPSTNDEEIQRVKKRMEVNDVNAFHWLGCACIEGCRGVAQDWKKGMGLLLRASQLGSINANNRVASEYRSEEDEERRDFGKTIQFWTLAAVAGHEEARYNLGLLEGMFDKDRSTKHFLIAARAGLDEALKEAGKRYTSGHVTKEEYASTLRAHKESQDEMKSEQRTKAFEEDVKRGAIK